MSNRTDINAIDDRLKVMDDELRAMEASIPSRNAVTYVTRARAMIRAAQLNLANALNVQMRDVDALDAPSAMERAS